MREDLDDQDWQSPTRLGKRKASRRAAEDKPSRALFGVYRYASGWLVENGGWVALMII